MKTKYLLLLASVVVFTSCTTMYKTGQTPDDVYFSPARTIGDANTETDDGGPTGPQANTNYYSNEDRMIRMGINDYRYRNFNNDYAYNPYTFSNTYNHNYGNYYNDGYGYPNATNIYFGNYYYNPYYSSYPVYILPSSPIKITTPRSTNLNGYGSNYNNHNPAVRLAPHPSGGINNSNNSRTSGLGNVLNKILAPSSNNAGKNVNNNNNTYYNNTQNNSRTYTPPAGNNTPAPSSSSSNSSGSSSSGHITRPH